MAPSEELFVSGGRGVTPSPSSSVHLLVAGRSRRGGGGGMVAADGGVVPRFPDWGTCKEIGQNEINPCWNCVHSIVKLSTFTLYLIRSVKLDKDG